MEYWWSEGLGCYFVADTVTGELVTDFPTLGHVLMHYPNARHCVEMEG